jgi:hypothetical protein
MTLTTQVSRFSLPTSPAGKVTVVYDTVDLLRTTSIDESLEAAAAGIKPNTYEIGKSGSVHSDAVNWNSVVNSVPVDGVTLNRPGIGGLFVVTAIDA